MYVCYVPVYRKPQKSTEEAGVSGLQVRLDDTRVDTVGRYASAAKTVVQGARVDDVGDFGVAVTFPESCIS